MGPGLRARPRSAGPSGDCRGARAEHGRAGRGQRVLTTRPQPRVTPLSPDRNAAATARADAADTQTTPLPQALTDAIGTERRRTAVTARLRHSALIAASIPTLTGATAGQADAAPAKLLPNIVDGVHHNAKQLRRFAHRPPYSRVSADGKTPISHTSLSDYRRALARQRLQLPTASAGRAAHAANFGAPPATVGLDNFLHGPCRDIASGMSVASLHAIDCAFWGCGTEFLNTISSARTRNNPMVLYDKVGFNFPGYGNYDKDRVVTIPAGLQVDLRTLAFPAPDGGTRDNRADSLYVWC